MNRRTERQDIIIQTDRIGVCSFVVGSASAMLIIMMTMLRLIFPPLGLVSLDSIDLLMLLTGGTVMIVLIAIGLHTFGVQVRFVAGVPIR